MFYLLDLNLTLGGGRYYVLRGISPRNCVPAPAAKLNSVCGHDPACRFPGNAKRSSNGQDATSQYASSVVSTNLIRTQGSSLTNKEGGAYGLRGGLATARIDLSKGVYSIIARKTEGVSTSDLGVFLSSLVAGSRGVGITCLEMTTRLHHPTPRKKGAQNE